ncbi:SGNH/GDSL hydrolase family protein [Jatrophihabitans telluris]|uniref:SGNH/GDSL hydrolase family protein n=1 Tax=Jatrophihabitans telluris TaxID=2038343 RepID=A0ABY4R3D9_9ACTN|nr:SGNH/GDSL hydrolase family protein [Jatrophihabitans telluris]UQX89766.1 SGNH/GDSL hydrolase family protein [Jatrophihabitans telluris]
MRYVAIGDSFTEGVGDEQADGSVRGWADLVASGLADSVGPAGPAGSAGGAARAGAICRYANLAIRGRLLEPIVTDQLTAALALGPSLITLNGGGNDIMRPRADLARLVRLTESAVTDCAAAGVRLVLISGPDPSRHLPLGARIHANGQLLADAVAELSQRHGLTYVDNWNDTEIRRSVYWSSDRLHLNPAGHRRVAARVLTALGAQVAPDWLADSVEAEARRGRLDNARYYREHVLPWVKRRLRHQSSGDGRAPKYGEWRTVPPADGADARTADPGAMTISRDET